MKTCRLCSADADYDNGEDLQFQCGNSFDGPLCVDCADEQQYLHENEQQNGVLGPYSETGCLDCRKIRQEDIAESMAEDYGDWDF